MTIAQIWMKHCPFCGSLDVDPQFSASQKEEDGPVEHADTERLGGVGV